MIKDSSEKQLKDGDSTIGSIKRRVGRPRKVSNLKEELESKIKVFDAKRSKSKNEEEKTSHRDYDDIEVIEDKTEEAKK